MTRNNQYSESGNRHGYWKDYYVGQYWQRGNYFEGRKVGYWEIYDYTDEVVIILFYI